MTQTFSLDRLQRGDWGKVRAIYKEGLATGIAAFMRDPPTWTVWDAGHLAIGRLVARRDNGIVGWAALGPVADT